MNIRLLSATGVFATGLIAIGGWRRLSQLSGEESAIGAGPTLAYIAWTVAAIVLLPRFGARFDRLGFGRAFSPRLHLGLATAGVVLLRLWGLSLEPLLAGRVGSGRDLTRFDSGASSLGELVLLMAFNWAFAAFGEEITFRVVLMRSLTDAFGDGRAAAFAALILQALVFGLVHSYQGPVGIVGTAFSGLVFGSLVLASRGSIWPAALAHGSNNSISLVLLHFR